MSLPPHLLFHMLNQNKKHFMPEPVSQSGTPAPTSIHLLAFSTSNYDAMIKFLRDFGFTVAENPYGDQLVPFFEDGRGARVSRGSWEFQLEESKSPDARARFNLAIGDATDADIERLKALGYDCKETVSPFGAFYSFRTPDGGMFVL